MGHVLGLQHEQVRADRDAFIAVTFPNIVTDAWYLFEINTNESSFGDYDFESVMHYDASVFSVDPGNLKTFEPTPAYASFEPRIGNPALSRGDRAAAAHLYGPAEGQTSVVTNTRDAGPGTLRAALYFALDYPGSTVTFDISTNDAGFSNGACIVNFSGNLPVLAGDGVRIDGTSQPGYSNHPVIVLRGSDVIPEAQNVFGFLIFGANCEVKGLCIQGFNDGGIYIQYPDATNNVVRGCHIGTDAAGLTPQSNALQGIGIWFGAKGNTIGGPNDGDGNVISGNAQYGILILHSNTTGNTVIGNFIGTDAAGNAPLPNGLSGIGIWGGASGNRIGGSAPGEGNLLSGHIEYGVFVSDTGTTANVIEGNRIGLDAAGAGALGNAIGVGIVRGAAGNIIGGTAPNGTGVGMFSGARDNLLGGTVPSARNVISGNLFRGILLADPGTSNNLVQGNFIGTDTNGTAALANGGDGIAVVNGPARNVIGGSVPGAGNLISGNGFSGVAIFDSNTGGNLVQGNFVGTGMDGSSPLGNGFEGIALGLGAHDNVIGLDRSGSGAGNRIAFNTYHGVRVADAGTTGNTIRGNAVFSNGYIGINLVGGVEDFTGVTSNDLADTDLGPNELQNAPQLTNAVVWGPVTTIQGILDGQAHRDYHIDFFRSAEADISGFGEGEVYIGSTTVNTDSSGQARFSFGGEGAATGAVVTATATDAASGDSSEFGGAQQVGADVVGPPEPFLGPMTPDGAGNFGLEVAWEPGWSYHLQSSTNIVDWVPVTNYISLGAMTNLAGASATDDIVRVYRIVSP